MQCRVSNFAYCKSVTSDGFIVYDDAGVELMQGFITSSEIASAANEVNEKLRLAREMRLNVLDLFDVIDLRMLSGLIGELFSSVLSLKDDRLLKNPNIDGYPDLCDVSSKPVGLVSADFVHFPFGGIEVKNTFGVKKAGAVLRPRESRRGKIQRQLVWKAHHRSTNGLLGLQSDYIDGIPQIVAGYYSSDLVPEDWTIKQNPRGESTMTSFCQTRPSAYEKLARGTAFVHPSYI